MQSGKLPVARHIEHRTDTEGATGCGCSVKSRIGSLNQRILGSGPVRARKHVKICKRAVQANFKDGSLTVTPTIEGGSVQILVDALNKHYSAIRRRK